MKLLLICLLIVGSVSAYGQYRPSKVSAYHPGELAMASKIDLGLPKFYHTTLTSHVQLQSYSGGMLLSPLSIGNSYWSGSTMIHYSKDGQVRTQYTYDLLGNMRDAKIAFALKKKH